MATVFLSIIASTGAGLAVASGLVAYAQRNWKGYGRVSTAEESA
ncbi:hypothetical protein [Pseudonocardia sp. HH130630-07]|nr:hypothetical protein [Pseudonocardia sp. HH130630-07]